MHIMIQEISPKDTLSLLQENNAILIDVREKEEWDQERITSAQHYPLSTFAENIRDIQVPNGYAIVFHCLVGGRSKKAAQLFSMYGNIENHTLYNMTGGINQWKADQLPDYQGS